MDSLTDFALNEEYKRIQRLGDKLSDLASLIDGEAFQPVIGQLYINDQGQGGQPKMDVILMMKRLVLPSLYGLSDPELERQANDRISFRKFLGFPETIPDHTTVWYFRERLIETGKEKAIWEELQRQLDEKGLQIRRGVIQDATFITADPGQAFADTLRGDEAKTRRSQDGTWAKKGKKSLFGFKLPILMDRDHQLIRRVETTPAALHDSQVDLSQKGETVYRDAGNFGVIPQASLDKTLHRAVRGHPLSIPENRRNRAIRRTRSLVDRPFAVIERVFQGGHVLVTTGARVPLKNLFSCLAFNLTQLRTIHRHPSER
ncbi:MAG: IS5 family transposase [Methanomicrobiales archaeon]|nr:IS5 family transposase [Methanomicrobiales archaeon]